MIKNDGIGHSLYQDVKDDEDLEKGVLQKIGGKEEDVYGIYH